MNKTTMRPSRLIPLLGLALAACSSGGGGGAASAVPGRITGRALADVGAASLLASTAAVRPPDDDALRARDIGDAGPAAPTRARGGFGERNRADWLRSGMTTTGSGHVRLTADGDVALTVYRLRQGHAPHEAVYTARGTSIETEVAVDAGDHLLLAVQGQTGSYELGLDNSDRQPALLAAPAAPALAFAATTLADALPEVVPGEVIVRGVDDTALVAVQSLGFEVLARSGDVVRLRSVVGTALRDDASGRAALADALFRLRRALPQAQWVEPNFVVRATRQPGDQFLDAQWAVQATNLDQAWDTTIGEPIVIAVVDSGILKNHPDLRANVLADGFDFISDPNNGDRDGIDADPEDVLVSGNDFHGSHCAGIAAAVTDNGVGIAGVNWNARILPLRVLGPGGGSFFDIAEAIRYAAGLPNVSRRTPSRPARIINLSLGGRSDSAVLHDAVRDAAEAGAILVVAAGNSALAGNPIEFPAAYEEVITVGAVGPTGDRAPYSGFKDYVHVAAPGGDLSRRAEDGILSTVAVEQDGEFFFAFRFLQGTSMAAPFVSGAVSLMLSVNPGLTSQDVKAILAQTSRDRGAPGRDPEFGFGLIDVAAAVAAAGNGAGGGEPRLRVDRTQVQFSPDRLTRSLRITSSVPGRELAGLVADFVGEGPDGLSGQFSSLTTPATLTLEVTAQLAAQPQSFTIGIASSDAPGRLDVRVRIVSGSGGATGTLVVELLDANGQLVKTADAAGGNFAFEALAPGNYRVRAGIDSDRNGRITDIGDFASDDTPVALASGGSVDVGTLRARRRDVAGGGSTDLTGEFGHSEPRGNSSLTIVYTFRADGIVDQQRLFSTPFGTTESNARGTFSVRGDTVTIQVDGDTFDATIERSNGEIQALRIGNDRYQRL